MGELSVIEGAAVLDLLTRGGCERERAKRFVARFSSEARAEEALSFYLADKDWYRVSVEYVLEGETKLRRWTTTVPLLSTEPWTLVSDRAADKLDLHLRDQGIEHYEIQDYDETRIETQQPWPGWADGHVHLVVAEFDPNSEGKTHDAEHFLVLAAFREVEHARAYAERARAEGEWGRFTTEEAWSDAGWCVEVQSVELLSDASSPAS
jgi:hypothetical protein